LAFPRGAANGRSERVLPETGDAVDKQEQSSRGKRRLEGGTLKRSKKKQKTANTRYFLPKYGEALRKKQKFSKRLAAKPQEKGPKRKGCRKKSRE